MKLEDKFLKNTKKLTYGDFKTNFNVHPGSKDLVLMSEVDSIKYSIINIIKTSRFSRPFQPTLGCYINDMIFEQMDNITLSLARQTIKDAIAVHEPRAQLRNVIISPSEDENGIYVSIVFNALNSNTPITLDIVLDRIR
jgi:phage baseplate assembly protein W